MAVLHDVSTLGSAVLRGFGVTKRKHTLEISFGECTFVLEMEGVGLGWHMNSEPFGPLAQAHVKRPHVLITIHLKRTPKIYPFHYSMVFVLLFKSSGPNCGKFKATGVKYVRSTFTQT